MTDRLRSFWEASSSRAIKRLESLPVSPSALAVYFAVLLAVRELFEQTFFESSFNIYRFNHHVFFLLFVLLAGILGISRIGRIDLLGTARVVASGYILLILPPLIDHFLFGRSRPYEYVLPGEFIKNIFSLFLSTTKAGPGILLEIFTIMALAGVYVLIRSRSPRRALLTGLFLYVLAALAATPRLFLPLPSLENPVFRESRHLLFFCYHLILSAAAGVIFLATVQRNLPRLIFREIWSFRTLHFLIMAGAGLYSRGLFSLTSYPDVLNIFLVLALMGLIWTVTVLINNVYDLPIDRMTNPGRPLARGEATPYHYLQIASILAVVCVFISLTLGPAPVLITAISLLSAAAYSVPPLRLRMRLLSNGFIAWGSVLAFYLGYFAFARPSSPQVDGAAARLSLVLFLALFFGSFSKDLKDYEGDLRSGIRTIFTVFGLAKGRAMASVSLGISLLTPLLIFHRTVDVLIFSSTGALTGLFFYRLGKLRIPFAGYILAALYCLGRSVFP